MNARFTSTRAASGSMQAALVLFLCAVLPLHPLRAQTAPDSAACAATLRAPTRDSALVKMTADVSAFDTAQVAGDDLLAFVADAFRQSFRPPDSLALSVYDGTPRIVNGKVDSTVALLVLDGAYRFVLRADGRIEAARSVGGTGDVAFDARVLEVLDSINANHLIPPFSDAQRAALHDSLPARLAIGPEHLIGRAPRPRTHRVSLFAYRTPLRRRTAATAPLESNAIPRYPLNLLASRVRGAAVLQFVVDRDGSIRPGSYQVLSTDAYSFVDAVMDALPSYRFTPLMVDGCPVASLNAMPFHFDLNPR